MRPLEPGTVVAGYRIESLVGRGGMGVVYRALQVGLERIVALKVIAPELLDEEDVRRRFLAEARAAASVDHPNVIPVHEAGEDDGVAFIAMRFVAGSDLRSLVRRGGALEPAEAADYVAQAAAALDAIHRAGFVHRDIKPANLLVDPGGHVYVTDFGLAKQVLTGTGARTGTGHWVGTLDYVAPEQIRGGRVDARADVYALGGVLHFALTGRVPFEREGDEAKLWAQLSAPPPVPSALRRGLRGEFDGVVARAMAKEAGERQLSAGDLGRAALAAAAGTTPTEPERVVARGAAAPGAASTEPGLAGEVSTRTADVPPLWPGSDRLSAGDADPVSRPRRRALTPWLVAASAVAVALIVAVVLLTGGDPGPSSARSTPTPTPSATATPVAAVAQTIQNVSDRPNALAVAGGDLWVASARQPRLTRVDATTGREHAFHPKVGMEVTALVAFKDDVWVTVGATREVVQLDGATGKPGRRWKVSAKPVRLAVDATGVWIGTQAQGDGAGQLLRYDLAGHLVQAIAVNEGVGGLASGDGALWVIKARTNKLTRLIPGQSVLTDWAALPAPAGAIRYDGGALWVTLDDEDAVARIAADGGNLRTVAAGHSPAQSVLAGGHLFVASRNDNTVVVLDPKTFKPVGEPIEVGFNPYAMVADERSVWVAGLGDNTLTRIDYR
jgi:DNA-binding beta-propeller fold protein YncE